MIRCSFLCIELNVMSVCYLDTESSCLLSAESDYPTWRDLGLDELNSMKRPTASAYFCLDAIDAFIVASDAEVICLDFSATLSLV